MLKGYRMKILLRIVGKYRHLVSQVLKILNMCAFCSCLVLAQNTEDYEVKKGNTLWGISKQLNNDPSRWREIYRLNNNIIKDPNLVYPGQKLKISLPTRENSIEAVDEAALTPQSNPEEALSSAPDSIVESEARTSKNFFSESKELSSLKISRIDLDLGVAILKLINDDTPNSNIHVGGVLGVDTLFLNTWGLRALARSSLIEVSAPKNFKPVWLNAMLQYQFLENAIFNNITLIAKANVGVEYYKNLSQDQAQRFVRNYSGVTTGLSLNFELGESKLYTTGGDFIYTFFSSGQKVFVHGNIYRKIQGTRWSIGAGYWADILNTTVGFDEKIFSIESHVRYTF